MSYSIWAVYEDDMKVDGRDYMLCVFSSEKLAEQYKNKLKEQHKKLFPHSRNTFFVLEWEVDPEFYISELSQEEKLIF